MNSYQMATGRNGSRKNYAHILRTAAKDSTVLDNVKIVLMRSALNQIKKASAFDSRQPVSNFLVNQNIR